MIDIKKIIPLNIKDFLYFVIFDCFYFWYILPTFGTSKRIFTYKYPSIFSMGFVFTCIMIIIIAIIREICIFKEREKRKYIYFLTSILLYIVVIYIYAYFMNFTFKQFIDILYFKISIDHFVIGIVVKYTVKHFKKNKE
ncbi:hypothetical protein JCM30566_07770 [Marinitoga arctica]